jgi:hypothetical protein
MAAAGEPTFNVLLIDAQNDFCDDLVDYAGLNVGAPKPIGRLPVVGAGKDCQRISKFLQKNAGAINKVYASMDTHTTGHIGHWLLAKASDGAIAGPGTVFKVHEDKIFSWNMAPGGGPIEEYVANVADAHKPAMN